jgi:pimeloyl-ACP methyl ester carboxylesterase
MSAESRPDLVSALVLYGYPRAADFKFEARPTPSAPPRRPTTAEAAAEDFITSDTISKAALDVYVKAAVGADPVRADWTRLEQFNAMESSRLSMPTLVIHGGRDPYAPSAVQAELVRQIPASHKAHVVLRGYDHAAHLEDLRGYVAAVLELVRR